MKKLFLVTTAVALVMVLGTSTGAATDKAESLDCTLTSTQPAPTPYQLSSPGHVEMSSVWVEPPGCFPLCTDQWCGRPPFQKPYVEWYCVDGSIYPNSCHDYCISPG